MDIISIGSLAPRPIGVFVSYAPMKSPRETVIAYEWAEGDMARCRRCPTCPFSGAVCQVHVDRIVTLDEARTFSVRGMRRDPPGEAGRGLADGA